MYRLHSTALNISSPTRLTNLLAWVRSPVLTVQVDWLAEELLCAAYVSADLNTLVKLYRNCIGCGANRLPEVGRCLVAVANPITWVGTTVVWPGLAERPAYHVATVLARGDPLRAVRRSHPSHLAGV